MGIYFNPGNEGFASDVNSDIYVDKTGLIKHMNKSLGKAQRCIAVSHARRFGKSQAAGMLEAYYSLGCDSKELFAPFEIAHENYASVFKYNDENSLSCVLTMAYFTAPACYTVIRELPGGKGFVDLVFIPRTDSGSKPAIMVELKADKDAETAIRQIKERRYAGVLQHYKGAIILVGINYDKASKKHTCLIEKI